MAEDLDEFNARVERAAEALVASGYLFTMELARTVARITLNTE